MRRRYDRPVFVGGAVELRNPLQAALASVMDGERRLEEICGKMLLEGHDPDAIFVALDELEAGGHVAESGDTDSGQLSNEEMELYARQMDALAAYAAPEASGGRTTGASVQVRLKRAVVVIAGFDAIGKAVAQSLAKAGVGRLLALPVADEGGTQCAVDLNNPFVALSLVTAPADLPRELDGASPDLLVYCPDAFDEGTCEWLNRECLARAMPFLPYRRENFDVRIGPLVLPGETACYVCYQKRRDAARMDWQDEEPRSRAQLNFALGVDWLAVEIVKVLIGVTESVTRGRLWRMNFESGVSEVYTILKLPRCPACGVHRVKPPRKLWEE